MNKRFPLHRHTPVLYCRVRNIVENWVRKTALPYCQVSRRGAGRRGEGVSEGLKALRDVLRTCEEGSVTDLRQLAWWLDWQTAKRDVSVVVVDPRSTAMTCPKCDAKPLAGSARCGN